VIELRGRQGFGCYPGIPRPKRFGFSDVRRRPFAKARLLDQMMSGQDLQLRSGAFSIVRLFSLVFASGLRCHSNLNALVATEAIAPLFWPFVCFLNDYLLRMLTTPTAPADVLPFLGTELAEMSKKLTVPR